LGVNDEILRNVPKNFTNKIFYVAYSRAIKNLVMYYPNPTDSIVIKAIELIGEENVVEIK